MAQIIKLKNKKIKNVHKYFLLFFRNKFSLVISNGKTIFLELPRKATLGLKFTMLQAKEMKSAEI